MHFSRFANQGFSETSLGEDSKQSSKKHFLHFTSDSKPKTTNNGTKSVDLQMFHSLCLTFHLQFFYRGKIHIGIEGSGFSLVLLGALCAHGCFPTRPGFFSCKRDSNTSKFGCFFACQDSKMHQFGGVDRNFRHETLQGISSWAQMWGPIPLVIQTCKGRSIESVLCIVASEHESKNTAKGQKMLKMPENISGILPVALWYIKCGILIVLIFDASNSP